MADWLSALRLCVRLCDNSCIELIYIDYHFPLAFGTIQRKVYKYCVGAYLNSGFATTKWTQYPFFFFHRQITFPKKNNKNACNMSILVTAQEITDKYRT